MGWILILLGVIIWILVVNIDTNETKVSDKLLSDLKEIVEDSKSKKEVIYAWETLMNEWDNFDDIYEVELLRLKGVLLDKIIKFI